MLTKIVYCIANFIMLKCLLKIVETTTMNKRQVNHVKFAIFVECSNNFWFFSLNFGVSIWNPDNSFTDVCRGLKSCNI